MTDTELRLTDDTITTKNRTIDLPTFTGDTPVNYQHFRDSIALAMAGEGLSEETLTTVLETVDQAVVNNEQHLVWESDLEAGVEEVTQ